MGDEPRAFRMPAIQVAEARIAELQSRYRATQSGCMLVAGALLVSVGGLVPASLPLSWLAAAGLLLLLVGFRGLRYLGCLATLLGAAGLGALLIAGLRLGRATGATWVAMLAIAVLGIAGAVLAFGQASAAATLLPFLQHARRYGCRIAFFRPFRPDYSEKARNLLVPLLRNYGDVFFVEDDTFEGQPIGDTFVASGFKALRGLERGRRYSNDEWMARVQQQLQDVDIAVVDISVITPHVVWELNECYDRLPGHRLILVAAGDTFGPGPVTDHVDEIQRHAVAVVSRLLELNPDLPPDHPKRHLKPLLLVYGDHPDGRVWLLAALHHAMQNIVALETTERPLFAPAQHRP